MIGSKMKREAISKRLISPNEKGIRVLLSLALFLHLCPSARAGKSIHQHEKENQQQAPQRQRNRQLGFYTTARYRRYPTSSLNQGPRQDIPSGSGSGSLNEGGFLSSYENYYSNTISRSEGSLSQSGSYGESQAARGADSKSGGYLNQFGSAINHNPSSDQKGSDAAGYLTSGQFIPIGSWNGGGTIGAPVSGDNAGGGQGQWSGFGGGFPITCRRVIKGKMGEVERKRVTREKSGGSGTYDSSYYLQDGSSSRSTKGKGGRLGYGSVAKSRRKSKSAETTSYSYQRYRPAGNSNSGFLSSAGFFDSLTPIRRWRPTRPVRRNQIFTANGEELECYYGAFGSLTWDGVIPEYPIIATASPIRSPTTQRPGIIPTQRPAGPQTVPLMTSAPSIGPTSAAPTSAPMIQTTSPTSSPTTLNPTVVPGMPTAAPTVAPTSTPTVATVAPTVATVSPTTATVAPTAGTTAPTAATTTATPTIGTAAPSIRGGGQILTMSPTTFTAAPTAVAITLAPTVGIMPTISSQPTISPQPTLAMQTRRLEAFLSYGFFNDSTVTDPTDSEINGLINETVQFYTSVFDKKYPYEFDQFQFQLNNRTFNATANLPVVLDFSSFVTFLPNSTSLPSSTDLFLVMENADYKNYIQQYVWNSPPSGNVFSNVMRVIFMANRAATSG